MPQKRVRRMERRRVARADANLSMRVEGAPSDGQLAQIVTETQNISASGVYCSSSHYLAPLSKVALTIVLPSASGTRESQRLLKCEVVVVRCLSAERPIGDRRFELACSFLGLDERRLRLLSDFVTWRNLQAMHAPMVRRTGRATTGNARSRVAAAGRARSATPARRAAPASSRTAAIARTRTPTRARRSP